MDLTTIELCITDIRISYKKDGRTFKKKNIHLVYFVKGSESPALSGITMIVFITRKTISLSFHCFVLYLIVVCQSRYTCKTKQLWVKQDFNVRDVKNFDSW